MISDNTDFEAKANPTSHNYFRGISAVLIFLFTLAGLSSGRSTYRAAFFGAAGLTGAITVTLNYHKNKKEVAD